MHMIDNLSISSYCSYVNFICEHYVELHVSFLLLYYNYQKMEGTMLKDFGSRLRKLREEAGLTQAQIAKEINCSHKVLSNYELNKREPDFSTLNKLCDFFNVTADYLLGRTDHPHYYKEMALSSESQELLRLMESLPKKYQTDILRYSKLNMMAFEYMKSSKHHKPS